MDKIIPLLTQAEQKQINALSQADLLAMVREALQLRQSKISANGSYQQGRNGEEYIKAVLKDRGYEFIDTSKRKCAGDVHVILHDATKIMIESKNYSNLVPTAEFDKFKFDLEHCTDVDAGVFICLEGGVPIMPPFKFMVIGSRQLPIIYVHSSQEAMIDISINLLKSYLESKVIGSNETDKFEAKLDKIYRCVSSICEKSAKLAIVRIALEETRSSLDKSINSSISQILLFESQLADEVNKIKKATGRRVSNDLNAIVCFDTDTLAKIMNDKKCTNAYHIQMVISLLKLYLAGETRLITRGTVIEVVLNNVITATIDVLKTKTRLKLRCDKRMEHDGIVSVPSGVEFDGYFIILTMIGDKCDGYTQVEKMLGC